MTATQTHPGHHPQAPSGPALQGLIAEFDTPEQVVEAARRAYGAGYRTMDAYAPFPVDGLPEALGFNRNRVAPLVFLGGLMGGIGGFLLQYFSAVIHYPVNIGGRPFFSWPSFLPVTFELTVLLASFSAVIGMIVLNGLPKLYQPVFNAQGFDRASQDKFFLMIEARDSQFDPDRTRQFLSGLGASHVTEVEG